MRAPVMQLLWAGCATALSPALLLLLRVRAAGGKEDRTRLGERTGRTVAARPAGILIWMHAASVGETLSALPLLAALPANLHILFTTGTLTSAALLRERLDPALAARVTHQFVPLDVPAWAARFLDHWRPDAACFLESELWPNLLAACARCAIPIALVNARLSDRSSARWARAGEFARAVLGRFAWIAAQSEADAARLVDLGGCRVDFPGNLKLAAKPLPADDTGPLRTVLADRPRWLAASTHRQDDAIIAETHRQLRARHPGLLTAIVPRHPRRGAEIAAFHHAPRRSQGAVPDQAGLWIADTLGELGLLYRCFPLVVMGKSFARGREGGGQNPWEAAQLGCAIVCGPEMGNFAEAVGRLRHAGGLLTVSGPGELVETLDRLLADPARIGAMGAASLAATQAASGLPGVLAGRLAVLAGVA